MLYDFLMANISRFFWAAATAAISVSVEKLVRRLTADCCFCEKLNFASISLKTLSVSLLMMLTMITLTLTELSTTISVTDEPFVEYLLNRSTRIERKCVCVSPQWGNAICSWAPSLGISPRQQRLHQRPFHSHCEREEKKWHACVTIIFRWLRDPQQYKVSSVECVDVFAATDGGHYLGKCLTRITAACDRRRFVETARWVSNAEE